MKRKFVLETNAAKSISSYLIFSKNMKKLIGKALVHHGKAKTFVNLWLDDYVPKEYLSEEKTSMIYGSASGYGYNKEHSAFARAIAKIAYKRTDKWNAKDCRYEVKPVNFDSSKISKVESSGIGAIQDFIKCIVIQAI